MIITKDGKIEEWSTESKVQSGIFQDGYFPEHGVILMRDQNNYIILSAAEFKLVAKIYETRLFPDDYDKIAIPPDIRN